MRIIHVIRRLDPATGGPPVVVLQLAAAQAAACDDVHILCHEDPATSAGVDALVQSVRGAEAVTIHRIPCRSRLTELIGPALLRRFDQLVNNEDPTVVHLHGVWEAILVRVAAQARRRDVPYVIMPHGLLDPYSLTQKGWKKRLALALFHRRMLDEAAAIHTLNEDEKQLIGPLELPTPCFVVPNGVDLDALLPLPEPGVFRAQHTSVGQHPYFLFLSRLHHKKGLDILAETFAQYARHGGTYRLVVVGPDEGQRDNFQKLIAEHGLTDRVHLTGPLYGDDKKAALRDAAAFILPSRQEGHSAAVLEAMACGLPVLISDACHFPQVADAEAGHVLPLDPAAFAKTMQQIEADPEHAARTGERGTDLVRKNYTWPRIAEQLKSEYTQLLPDEQQAR